MKTVVNRILCSSEYTVLAAIIVVGLVFQCEAFAQQEARSDSLRQVIPVYVRQTGGVRIHSRRNSVQRYMIPMPSNPPDQLQPLADIQRSELEILMRVILEEAYTTNLDTLVNGFSKLDYERLAMQMEQIQQQVSELNEELDSIVLTERDNLSLNDSSQTFKERRAQNEKPSTLVSDDSRFNAGLTKQIQDLDTRYEGRFAELARDIALLQTALLQHTANEQTRPINSDPEIDLEALNTVQSFEEVERALLQDGIFRTALVHFEFDRSELMAVSHMTLDMVGRVLTESPEIKVQVIGHTDSTGSSEYNLLLSTRRAQSVQTYLVQKFSLETSQISFLGAGELEPIADNGSRTGRALNRRVDFQVMRKD